MAGHLVREETTLFSPAFEVINHQVLIRNEVKILVPLIGWIKAIGVVVHLAPTGHVITVVFEVMGQGHEIRISGPPPVTIAVETSGGCAPAGENRRPTGSALRTGRVGIGEQETALGQRVDVGRRDAVRAEAPHPVVHVIHDDHEHVGLLRGAGCGDTKAPDERDQYCPATVYHTLFM